MGLFEVKSEKFKPQCNETILSLQYCKLIRQQSEQAEELVGYLRIKANKCGEKEKDRKLKEQFTNGINDDDMMTEIIRELTTIKKTKEVTCQQVFTRTRKVEIQRVQNALTQATMGVKTLMPGTIKEKEQCIR